MKNLGQKLFIFITIIIFILAFSSSYFSLSMDNLAYVLAIGIEKADNDNLQVSFQFSTTSPSTDTGSTEKTSTIINSTIANSISSAIIQMNSYMGKEINLSHCKAILFSEELAAEGISEEIYTLINNTQIRPSSNLMITKCSTKTYLEQTNPELENLIAKYYEILSNSSKYTGYMPDATIGNFFNNLISKTSNPYAILGNLISEPSSSAFNIDGKDGSENVGMAVFKNDALVGELSTTETLAFLTIDGKVDRFLISVPDPEDSNHYLDIYFTPANCPEISVDTSTSNAYIKIDMKLTGQVFSMSEKSNYLDPNVLDDISATCNSYLESTISSYLYKTAKEFNADINGLGNNAMKNFFTLDEFNNYNWLDNYQNSVFDVNINTSIKSRYVNY